jgi:hypothetical protein
LSRVYGTITRNEFETMENWIGVGVWIVLGALIGFGMKVGLRGPENEQPGHVYILAILGAFGSVVGGMLGVGIFHFYEPLALSPGGIAGAVALSSLLTWTYRFGTRALV